MLTDKQTDRKTEDNHTETVKNNITLVAGGDEVKDGDTPDAVSHRSHTSASSASHLTQQTSHAAACGPSTAPQPPLLPLQRTL